MDISFNVTGQIITRTDANVIVGDSKNYHRAVFVFSSEWLTVNKVAQFSKKIANFKNGPVFDCLIEDNSCLIPWEVLIDSGSVELSIFGGDLITTRPIVFNVAPSGLKDGQLPEEPTPGYFQQVIDYLAKDFKGDKGDKGDKGEPGEVQLSDLTATNIDYTDTNSKLGDAADVQTALDNVGTQLAEKVQNFKLKNEVVNGDFALSSLGNWFSYASTITVADNALVVTGSGTNFRNGADYSVIKSFSVNDVVYARAKAKTSDSITQSLRIEIMNNGLTAVLASNQVNAPTSDIFYDLSILYKYTVAETLRTRLMVRAYYADATTQNAKKLTIDNVLFINLTSIFGAGNEPTRLEMDELMKVIPNGWWDGELSLTQKQFITWQLNLIRKNTNAIIALGGTII